MILQKKKALLWILASFAAITSCKVYQPKPIPTVATPVYYTDSTGTDTLSMSYMRPQDVFVDPYLTSLIDSVLRNNLDLKRAYQRIQVAQSRYAISSAALLPRVEGVVSAGFDKYGNYTQNGVGNYDTKLSPNVNSKQDIPYPITPDFLVGLRSTWEVDIWGKLRNLKKASLARYLATEKGAQFIKTSLIGETARLYYQLMALDKQLQVIQDNITLQDSALEIVKIQKQAARVNELAVQQFTAQLLNTKALEGGVRQEITETENEMNYLLGRFPQRIQRDSSLLKKSLPKMTSAGVPSQLLTRRPDIQQAELELAATGAEVKAARAAFFPSLKVTPYVGMNSFKLPLLLNGGSVAYGILGSLTAPIFYQGALKRGLKIADATQQDAFYNYQQTIHNGVREVVNNLSRLENMKNVFSLKQQEVQTLDSAVVTSNLLFKTGYASYLEVITAQRNVVDAQLQLVNAKAQMFYSVVDLYKALGGGWQ